MTEEFELGSIWATRLVLIALESLRLIAKSNSFLHRRSMSLPDRLIKPSGMAATLEEIHTATAAFPGIDRLVVGLAPAITLPVTLVSLLASMAVPIPNLVSLRTSCVLLRSCLPILGIRADRGFVENYIPIPDFPVIPVLVLGSTPA